jgi:glutamate synthase (NADPH/NADH) small chain
MPREPRNQDTQGDPLETNAMKPTQPLPPVACGRLTLAEYADNFAESNPPLTPVQAKLEAERCYYCFDAPCIAACPTGIDVPTFIYRIAQGNLRGAAQAILEPNVLGGMCARVCPTEVLCEQACVRNANESKPVEIAQLQRHATDAYFDDPGRPLFVRAQSSGRTVAVIGSGPAGLACAHRVAMLGHAVVMFESKPKLGGLNEYGLATYKTTGDFAQKEIAWLLSIGGIGIRSDCALGRDIHLDALVREFDAVFLGVGLDAVNALSIPGAEAAGVRDAVDFIAELRQAKSPADVAIGRRVVVIGGGMTAVDAAVQSRKLGAEDVTIVYRRGKSSMSASGHEQDWAQVNGVRIKHWGAPRELVITDGRVTGIRFARTEMRDQRLVEREDGFTLEADLVLKAIGQAFDARPLGISLTLRAGRIVTDADGRTSHQKIWAGGDCRHGGRDLTVEAVHHGKVAAISIDRSLRAAESDEKSHTQAEIRNGRPGN